MVTRFVAVMRLVKALFHARIFPEADLVSDDLEVLVELKILTAILA